MFSMNLKKRFRLVIFGMITLLLSIAVIVVIGIRHTNEHVRAAIAMGDLIVNLYELRILNSEYIAVPGGRVRQQWLAKYEQIKNKFSEQSGLTEDMKEALDGLKPVFERLTWMPEDTPETEMSQKRLQNQIVTTLNLETQRILDWANDISRKEEDSIIPHLVTVGVFTLAIILAFATLTIIIMLISTSHILSSLAVMKNGAEEIASGALGFQIEIVGNDEIASLTTAINHMSSDLKVLYENIHEQAVMLETEMAERQKIHEALQSRTSELQNEIDARLVTQQYLEEQTSALKGEIDERMRIQEEHARLEEQLLQSQKMEAIGLLAGGVAHDFNNILSVIMGYGGMLMANLPEGRAQANALQIIKASERAAELTKGLLAFSRKQDFNLERTDINQLATDNTEFLKRVIGEDIELVTFFHPSPLYILLDRSQIQQVLMNLATNALDAMPVGGRLTIEITSENLDEDFISIHGYGKPGGHAVIRVIDTGTGMDSGTVERIFEPFFTTKEKGKGTGLGLSIIHGIIAQHNGFIKCSSKPGAGTTFNIYLPLCSEGIQVSAISDNFETKSLRGCETILMAEDDRMLIEMITNSFESNGYKVIQAYDGAQAVEIFKKMENEIDLVLLDAIMPKMTGKQVWDEISALKPDVKACFVSGYTNEIISGKLAIDFKVPFISKPVTPSKLLQKVREILDDS